MKKHLVLILASLLLASSFASCTEDSPAHNSSEGVSDIVSKDTVSSTEESVGSTASEVSAEVSVEESSAIEAETEDSGTWGTLNWTLFAEGTLVIGGNGTMTDFDSSDAKDAWHGYKDSVKKVFIGDGVSSIGNYAFDGFTKLESAKIGSGIKTIGDFAFAACYVLKDVNLPEGLEFIGRDGFSLCMDITSITLPDSVKTLDKGAFYQCDALETMTIGKGLETVGDNAFAYGKSLKEIKVAEGNESFVSVDGVLYTKDKKTIVRYPAAKAAAAVVIPDGVETIGYGAFHSCVDLKEISIPVSVTKIDDFAFSRCENIEKVNYGGTAAEWAAIEIDNTNETLTDKYKG